MHNFNKHFPKQIIPHVTANNLINDQIHNYKSKNNATLTQNASSGGFGLPFQVKKTNLALDNSKPALVEDDIKRAFAEVQSE